MARVIFTRPAAVALQRIRSYIAQDSRHYAALTVRRIRAAVKVLGRFPESGRVVPELPEGPSWELIVGPYRVIYWYDRDEDRVAIINVIHGSRTLPPLDGGA